MKNQEKAVTICRKNKYIVKDILASRASRQTAKNPSQAIDFIHEYLQQVAVNGRWKARRDGRREFVAETRCKVPEGLQISFQDTKPIVRFVVQTGGEFVYQEVMSS